MKRALLTLLFFTTLFTQVNAQDTLIFKGQFSTWLNYNSEKDLSTWTGARYIPQLNYLYTIKNDQLIDIEVSTIRIKSRTSKNKLWFCHYVSPFDVVR